MNKKQLIKTIADQANITQKEANQIFSVAINAISGQLQHGETIRIAGFGNFTTKSSATRKIRNPSTGKITEITTQKSTIFKPSQTLKNLINHD